jgi:hypothetical protein
MVWTCFKNKKRIPKNVMNMKAKGKHPRGRPRPRKDVTQKEECGKKLRRRRNYGKKGDREVWLSDSPHKQETS